MKFGSGSETSENTHILVNAKVLFELHKHEVLLLSYIIKQTIFISKGISVLCKAIFPFIVVLTPKPFKTAWALPF